MDQTLLERIKKLREEIRFLLCNKLSYPKMIVSLLREREVSPAELFRMQELIDESIRAADAKLDELITEIENR